MEKYRLPVSMTEKMRQELEKMSEELNMSKNQLTILALHSLIASYNQKGTHIFADLLNVRQDKSDS